MVRRYQEPEDFTMSEMPVEGAAHVPAAPAPTADFNELVELMQLAHEAGDTESAMRFAEAIENREYVESQSDLVSAGMGFSEGATLGLGGELAAALRAGTEQFIDPYVFAIDRKMRGLVGAEDVEAWKDMSFGELVDFREKNFWEGKSYMDRYRQALESHKGMMDTARREDPYATFGGEMLGAGLLTAAPATHAVKGAATMPKQLMRLGGVGVGEGAITGYGHSEAAPIQAMAEDRAPDEVEQEVQRAAFDAGIMASIGGGMSVTLPLAGPLARKVGQMFSSPFTKNARLTETARMEVAEAIKKDLAEGGLTPQQAMKELQETPGMTVADLGPHMQEITESMVQRPTEGAKMMSQFLRERNVDQWKRMHPRLAEALTGDRNSNFYAARRQLLDDMGVRAKDAYDAAYAVPARLTQPMIDVLTNPQMRPALKFANEIREAAGKDPLDLDMLNTGQMFSTKELDELIRGMDTLVGKTFKKSKGNLGGMLKEMRNDFREGLYQQNPAFRDARQQWGNDKLNEEAMDKGLRIFQDDADLVAEVIRPMSEAEKTNFKIGTLQAIVRKLGNKVETADLSKDLWNKPNARQALEAAFGSKRKFDEFMDYIAQEQRMYETFYQAVGNSRTAKRLAQQEVAQGGGLAYALGYLGSMQLMPNMPMGLAGALSRRGYEQIANPSPAQLAAMNQQSRDLAGMLQSTDIPGLMTPHTIGGLLDTGIPMSSATATTGLLGTAGPNPQEETGMFP